MNKWERLIEKQTQKMDALLQQRSDLYDAMETMMKEDLIQTYVERGGTKELTLKHTKHEILTEMMDLVFPLDHLIRQNEMLMRQKEMEEGK
jgi:hypothetical protein